MPTPQSFDAARLTPPGPADGGVLVPNRPFTTTVTSPASAVAPCTSITAGDTAQIPFMGAYITWVSDTDCYLRIGPSSMNIATSSDYFLPAGVERAYWHDPQLHSHFSVLQKTAPGTIKRFRSNTYL